MYLLVHLPRDNVQHLHIQTDHFQMMQHLLLISAFAAFPFSAIRFILRFASIADAVAL